MTKEILEKYINDGLTTKEIGEIVGLNKRTVSWWAEKYGLNGNFKYKKNPPFRFEKIDSKEKAYFIGFLACDAYVNDTTKSVEVSVMKSDKEVVEYLAKICNANIFYDDYYNEKTRRFPHVSFTKKIPDVSTFIGPSLKPQRHLPIISKDLNRYMLLGAFDADGCITWGRRKDRNRLWQKVSFTSSLKILTCIQNILMKELSIATIIRPKTNEKCFVLEFADKNNVVKFIDYIYQDDFVVLHRKQLKAKALRLELEENGESLIGQYRAEPAEQEGVETSGESTMVLNNRTSIQGVYPKR